MKKSLVLLLAAAGAFAAGVAHAGGNVYWSIGISAPPIGTVISNAPGYYAPGPGYYDPAPGYYAPAPVYAYPPRVVYTPARPIYHSPQRVYERPAHVYHSGNRRHWDRDRDGIPDRYDRYDNRQDWIGQYRERDRDHDGIPDRHDRFDNRRHGH